MSSTVISVEHLSKSYRLGQIGTGTLTNDLRVWWARARGKPNPLLKIGQKDPSIRPSSAVNRPPSSASVSPSSTKDERTKDETTTDVGRPRTKDEGLADRDSDTIWALRDVSFSVQQGEVLGIIGRNGAGKSTILKILSQITAPTQGEVKVKGRIASLLEVGTGFHPELTGRENAYLNGAILGMTKTEVDRKFDEIVAFSEVEQFIDTPVKRYSSGMYVRLAFAVAAHLEPEILLVDEVLAVGDAQFQKKCLGKMGDVARGGRTVLFVSHNMTALQSLCHRAIWLESGYLKEEGEASQVVSDYLQRGASTIHDQSWDDPRTAPGNEKVRMRAVRLVPESEDGGGQITVRTPLRMEFEFWNLVPGTLFNFSMHLYDVAGLCVLNSGSQAFAANGKLVKGTCRIPANLLNDGTYRVMIMIVRDTSAQVYKLDDALVFEVHDVERAGNWYGKWPGVVRPDLRWDVASSVPGPGIAA